MPLSHHHHTADPALTLAAHCGPGEHSPHLPPTERTPWRRVSPQSPVSPDLRREALLLDGEQLLVARIPLSSGCDPVSSEALPSEQRTLQAPPRTPPQAAQRCPGREVGASGQRTAWPQAVWTRPFDSGPSGHLSPPGRGAAAKTGLGLRWGSGWLGNQGTQLLQAQVCWVPRPRCPLQPPRRGWAAGTRPLL